MLNLNLVINSRIKFISKSKNLTKYEDYQNTWNALYAIPNFSEKYSILCYNNNNIFAKKEKLLKETLAFSNFFPWLLVSLCVFKHVSSD